MKKYLMVLFLLLGSVAFAKTWEANLRSCDGYGGFWFPNHNWTDKGEPWIKPFFNGEYLGDYREYGLSFNYQDRAKRERCYETVENSFGMEWTPIFSDKINESRDSVYFFMSNCRWDSTYVCERKLSLESFLISDFELVKLGDYNLDNYHFFDLRVSYDFLTGMYFIYRKNSGSFEYNALCNIELLKLGCDDSYAIQCEFQDDGTLNFDKLPDAKMVPENFCSTQSIPFIRLTRFKHKNNFMNLPIYKVNGTPTTKNSSNIVVQNKERLKLQLKGN